MHRNQFVIVIAEDYIPTLNCLTRMFTKHGFEVRAAKDAIDALAEMDEDVDLIITDYDLPGLNGSDLQDLVKEKYQIPMVMITGLHHIDLDDCNKRFDCVVKKPFDPLVLIGLVKAMLATSYSIITSLPLP